MKKRINIELEKRLHAKAKVLAVLKEISLNEYLVGAIRSAVDDEKGVLEEKE
jgi:predicted HicB family RNase H-like nuclease